MPHRLLALPLALLLTSTGCSVLTPTARPPATYEGIMVLTAFPPIPDSAAATAWQMSVEPPPGMGADDTTYEAVGTLLTDLAERVSGMGGQGRIAFIGAPGADEARAVIQSWGAFSSMLGVEYDLVVRKGADGWYVAESRMRSHCHQGVTADGSACS